MTTELMSVLNSDFVDKSIDKPTTFMLTAGAAVTLLSTEHCHCIHRLMIGWLMCVC